MTAASWVGCPQMSLLPLLPFQVTSTWSVILYSKSSPALVLDHTRYAINSVFTLHSRLGFDLAFIHVFPSSRMNGRCSSHPPQLDSSRVSLTKTFAPAVSSLTSTSAVITGRFTDRGMQPGGLERDLDSDSEILVQESALVLTTPVNWGLSGIHMCHL